MRIPRGRRRGRGRLPAALGLQTTLAPDAYRDGMSPLISRGFRGRRRQDVDPSRIPPGQYVVDDFPVLSAGPTPSVDLDEWTFSITGAVDEPASWSWEEFLGLPSEEIGTDIHCVTKWSKFDTAWRGVSVDLLLEDVDTAADFVLAFCDGG